MSSRRPKYRRHSSRDIGFVEWRGERKYFKGRYGSPQSVAAYKAFLSEYCAEEPVAVLSGSGDVLIVRLLAAYLVHAEQYYPRGASSEFGHLRAIAAQLNAFAGGRRVTDFGPRSLKEFRDYLLTAKDANGEPLDWSRSYINHQISRVRRIFKWGVSEEIVPVEVHTALTTMAPLTRGRTTARETTRREPVELSAVNATLPHLSPVVATMVQFQLLTGARSQNVCELRPDEIDRTCEPWKWTPAKHKTSHLDRVLQMFIGPRGQQLLLPYLNREPTEFCFSPIEDAQWRSEQRRAERKTPLTPSQSSRKRRVSRRLRNHFDQRSYCRSIKAGIRRANKTANPPISMWTPHQLRHSRGTLVKERYGMEGAQATLGQASMDATQHYTRKMAELARRIAQEIG